MPRPVHFDLSADDPDRAITFYSNAFGWKFDKWQGPFEYWVITTGVDPFFALASIVADVMYGKAFPVVALEPDDFARLRTNMQLGVERSGIVRLV